MFLLLWSLMHIFPVWCWEILFCFTSVRIGNVCLCACAQVFQSWPDPPSHTITIQNCSTITNTDHRSLCFLYLWSAGILSLSVSTKHTALLTHKHTFMSTRLVLNLCVIGATAAVMDVHRAAREGVKFVGCVFLCVRIREHQLWLMV